MADNLNNSQSSEDSQTLSHSQNPDLWKYITILCWIAMMIFTFHSITRMVGAGDTWVAMACGRHFLNHGVDTVEPFSANSHKAGPTEADIEKWPGWAQAITKVVGLKTVQYWHPTGWVNQNWLTHVIFYWLTHESPVADADPDNGLYSYNTLVYWKIMLYVLTVICVYYTGRILGANVILSAVFACAAMFIGRSFIDVRPAGYSNLLTAAFLLVLVLATYRNVLYIWLLVPLTVFWCNLHGGYIYVFIMLVPFFGLNFISAFFPRQLISIGKRGLIHTIAAGTATLIACIVLNPFHLTNFTHTFEISISKHAEMWRTVHEWHSGFAWDNPVGTGFPFLIMVLTAIGSFLLWILSRYLKPKFLKAPKNEIESQRKSFDFLSGVIGCSAAILLCWVIFIGFSFCHADAASFFICVSFIGLIILSILKRVHFIWLLIPLTLLVVWLSRNEPGYSGRYIYPFLILPCYAAIAVSVSLINGKRYIKERDIIFAVSTAILSVLLMVILINPFKFSPISEGFLPYVKQFFEIKRIWRSRYEINLGFLSSVYANLFSGLYIINLFSAAGLYLLVNIRKSFSGDANPAISEDGCKLYETPRIDITYITIAALTVYMAYRSRRFIPIAGYAACPLIALLIYQTICVFRASSNFYRKGILAAAKVGYNLQRFFLCTAVFLVVAFGGYWGWKFKNVYLDPWPNDPILTSVFMRMTASHNKPFFACKFIKANNLSGKMLNYWTEGGFIAYGQEPDPNTGKTPLQLFMDGRAQAAYDTKAFLMWSDIMAGTMEGNRVIERAQTRKQGLTGEDYHLIGQAVNKRLKQHDVWIVLMPTSEKTDTFVKSLDENHDWACVYTDADQKMFADISTEKGRELYKGMFDGKTVFPDDFSRSLTLAESILITAQDVNYAKPGLALAIKAVELKPSQRAMNLVTAYSFFRDKEMTENIAKFCSDYLEDYFQNIQEYSQKDGYLHKLGAVAGAGNFLARLAESNNNQKALKYYSDKLRFLSNEGRKCQLFKIW